MIAALCTALMGLASLGCCLWLARAASEACEGPITRGKFAWLGSAWLAFVVNGLAAALLFFSAWRLAWEAWR